MTVRQEVSRQKLLRRVIVAFRKLRVIPGRWVTGSGVYFTLMREASLHVLRETVGTFVCVCTYVFPSPSMCVSLSVWVTDGRRHIFSSSSPTAK